MKRDEFDPQLNSLLLSAEKLIPEKALSDLPYMELAPTVHDWYDFEHELWEIGENIRQRILYHICFANISYGNAVYYIAKSDISFSAKAQLHTQNCK